VAQEGRAGSRQTQSREGLRFANQETQWNLRELAMMVSLDLTSLQPTNISTPITRNVYSCDFVTEMVAWASAPCATLDNSSA
jgi:hypothetical protein